MWAEVTRKVNYMLSSWISYDISGLNYIYDDSRTLILYVLTYASFQKSYPLESNMREHAIDQPLTYSDSLSIILKNALIIGVMPVKVFHISSELTGLWLISGGICLHNLQTSKG